MPMPELLIATGAGASALLALIALLRWAVPFVRRLGHAVDDIIGEPARPGVPERPGIVARLASIEDKYGEISARQDTTDARIDTLAQAFGAVVGREQTARIEAHREGQQLWQAVQQVASPEPPATDTKRGA